jgi:hypothetical protein
MLISICTPPRCEIREMDIPNVAFQNRFTGAAAARGVRYTFKRRIYIRHRTPAEFYLMEEEVEDTNVIPARYIILYVSSPNL